MREGQGDEESAFSLTCPCNVVFFLLLLKGITRSRITELILKGFYNLHVHRVLDFSMLACRW